MWWVWQEAVKTRCKIDQLPLSATVNHILRHAHMHRNFDWPIILRVDEWCFRRTVYLSPLIGASSLNAKISTTIFS